MLIATWNINGVKARLANLVRWLKEATPDVCCLQEIKCEDEAFPGEPLEELGYNVAVHGQKGFNGVAVLSKRPLEDVTRRLPGGGDSDQHSRYIEVVVPGDRGVVRIACLYLPNGNPIGTDKFAYKLDWMDRLTARAGELLADEEAFILAGDFNVIPTPFDVRQPELWINDALFQPETRARFRTLLISASPMQCACSIPTSRSTPSGTIRPAPGSGTSAFASTTRSCRRKPSIVSARSASTSMSAAGTSHPTMCRWSPSWIFEQRSVVSSTLLFPSPRERDLCERTRRQARSSVLGR